MAPLIRELNYKLQDIEDGLPEDKTAIVSPSIFQVITNYGQMIQQHAVGSGHTQSATINIEESDWAPLLHQLREEIKSATLSPEENKTNVDLVDGVEAQFRSGKPNKTIVQTLLGALPPLGNVASITSAIIALFG